MRYGVRQMVMAPKRFLELSEEEHAAAAKARQQLLNALHIEQKFRLLLAKYAEFEEELLRLTNRNFVFPGVTWGSMNDDLYEISRRLINYMTTAHLYTDQVQHDIKAMYGPEQLELVKKTLNEQFDQRLGYRAMEKLRNFVQHRSLPLHAIEYSRRLTNSQAGNLTEHVCTPSISMELLEAEGGFHAGVLAELKAVAGDNRKLDIKPLVREHVTGLMAAHATVRKLIRADTAAAEVIFNELLQRFTGKFGQDALLGAALVTEEDSLGVTSTEYLVPEIIDRRKQLMTVSHDARTEFVSPQARGDMTPWVRAWQGESVDDFRDAGDLEKGD